ncbi:hypothetical protein Q8791_22925 [Nocardiopsis sp. CT-R113]|uniref:Uncharacterized protein n=1 Tax=Nocardiopsis codii TaxID=3065942 RepID=A0ABU7KCW6_9ACTN|nr:hypothetical protein [Nocardiopsis sp. CT-R113]MEE2040074.1 hypothetical protein [Nocardiopsis sp. CT-R113]
MRVRYLCPIDSCPWEHAEDYGPETVAMVNLMASTSQQYRMVEFELAAHLGSHPVETWAGEVARLKRELRAARQTRTFAGFRLETSDQVPPGAVLVLPPRVPSADQDPDVEHVDGRPVSGMAVIRVGGR